MKHRTRSVNSIILLVSLSLYLFYMLFIQYAVAEIPFVFQIVATTIFLSSLFASKDTVHHPKIFFLYIAYCAFFGFLVSDNKTLFQEYLIQILKYIIPMMGVYFYVTSHQRLVILLYVISISVFCLACSLLIIGESSNTGAIVIEDLNANLFAVYINLGLAAELLLLCYADNIRSIIMIWALIVLEFYSQFIAASRRGILIFLFLLGVYLTILRFKKTSYKIAVIAVLILIGATLLLYVNPSSISDSTMLIRLHGERTKGDLLREDYRQVALKLFKESILFGKGLGCVANRIGVYSHSLYHETLACTGCFGAFLMILFYGKYLLFFGKLLGKPDLTLKDKSIITVTLGFIISILLSGIACAFIYDSIYYISISVFLGMYNLYYPKAHSEQEQSPQPIVAADCKQLPGCNNSTF